MNYEFKGTPGPWRILTKEDNGSLGSVLLDSIGRRNRKHPDKTCPICGVTFRAKQSSHMTCSRTCGYKLRGNPNISRKKPESWWINKRGYIEGRVWISETKKISVKQHRYIMEKHLGRKLSLNEDVHHIDGNKQNNSIENLEVITHSNHSILHNSKRVYKKGYKLNLTTEERERRSTHLRNIRATQKAIKLQP